MRNFTIYCAAMQTLLSVVKAWTAGLHDLEQA